MSEIIGNNDLRNDGEETIDLLEVFGALLHKWWLLLIVTIVMSVVGFVYSYFVITPKYQSTTSVYIMNTTDKDNITYSDTQLATILTSDYEALITSRYVLEKAIQECGLNESYASLASRISVSNKKGTRIIDISVIDPDPEKARYIADSVRQIAAEQIKSVMNIEAVNVVDQASMPTAPVSPSIAKWTVLMGAVGFFIVAAIILIVYFLDDTIKTSDDVTRYLGLPTIGLIPVMDNNSDTSKRKGSKSRKAPVKKKSSSAPVVKARTSSGAATAVDGQRVAQPGGKDDILDIEIKEI